MSDSYRQWKQWNPDSFAQLRSHEYSYYCRELAAVELAVGARVLELGFGNGSFLAYAKRRGWICEGVELDPVLVDAARAKGFDAHLGPELPKDTYDLIVAFDVLEHIPSEDLESTLRTISDRLSPGGHFIARFPNGQSPFGLVIQHGDLTHRTAIGSSMARQLALAAKLDVVAIRNQALWLHGNPIISVVRLAQRGIAKLLEICISAVFYDRIEPLHLNLVVHLRRPNAVSGHSAPSPGERTPGESDPR